MKQHEELFWPDNMSRSRVIDICHGGGFDHKDLEILKKRLFDLGRTTGRKVKDIVATFNRGIEATKDAGFVVYFTLGKTSHYLACDRFNRLNCNIRAVIDVVHNLITIAASGSIHLAMQLLSGCSDPFNNQLLGKQNVGQRSRQIA